MDTVPDTKTLIAEAKHLQAQLAKEGEGALSLIEKRNMKAKLIYKNSS